MGWRAGVQALNKDEACKTIIHQHSAGWAEGVSERPLRRLPQEAENMEEWEEIYPSPEASASFNLAKPS